MKSEILAENPRIELYEGDCLEILPSFPDKSFDLVLTSPQYNMGENSLGYQPLSTVGQNFYCAGVNDNRNEEQYVSWCKEIISHSLRVSRYAFWNIMFVRSTRNLIFDIQNEFRDFLKDIFIWEKQAVASITAQKGGMAKGWEYVLLFGNDNLSTFEYNNFPENGYVPNIKTWYKKKSFKEHHATFPLSLPSYFVDNFTKDSDSILDPFAGSGTTGEAAFKLNRNCTMIEIEPKYCDIIRRRIDVLARQGRLFENST